MATTTTPSKWRFGTVLLATPPATGLGKGFKDGKTRGFVVLEVTPEGKLLVVPVSTKEFPSLGRFPNSGLAAPCGPVFPSCCLTSVLSWFRVKDRLSKEDEKVLRTLWKQSKAKGKFLATEAELLPGKKNK